MGILLCFLFGITLRVFVPGNFVTFHDSPGKFFLYMLFPALAVALSRIAMTVKMLRSSILDEMNKDYIRTAFSRGRTRADALKHHALAQRHHPRHRFPGCDGGGTGRGKHRRRAGLYRARRGPSGLLASIGSRDFPVAQAVVVLLAAWVVVVNFIADVLYQYMDPRIRIQ